MKAVTGELTAQRFVGTGTFDQGLEAQVEAEDQAAQEN